jgi:thiamine biosynthesis lipoprotein
VGIQNPLDDRGAYAGYLELDEASVVTSGIYERFFTENGKRYHHILDTVTGYPVENGLLAVTIAAGTSMDADALSTAVFALGPEKGAALAETRGAGAVFIFEDKTIRKTSVNFILTDTGFHLIEP